MTTGAFNSGAVIPAQTLLVVVPGDRGYAAISPRQERLKNSMTDNSSNTPKQEMQAQSRKAPEQPAINIHRADLPDLAETFADCVDNVFFDGQTLRINFGVTRFDQLQQSGSVNARRFPACRLVLTPGAGVELMNQIRQLMARMVQAGVIKPSAQPSSEKKTS